MTDRSIAVNSACEHTSGALQLTPAQIDSHTLELTIFNDVKALTPTRIKRTWADLCALLAQPNAEYASKEKCMLLKLATFGSLKSKSGSLRTDANMLSIYGVEGDYDACIVSIDSAAAMLEKAGIEAMIYSSASHMIMKDGKCGARYRIIAPLAYDLAPSEHGKLVAKLNWALGGILASESFTQSQSYYFGKVKGVQYESRRVRGQFIDTIEGLGEIGKPETKTKAAGAGDSGVRTDLSVAYAGIQTGERYHQSLLTLASSMSAQGMPAGGVVKTLRALMDSTGAVHDDRWTERYKDIPRIVSTACDRFAPCGDDVEAKRRVQQQIENAKIGEGFAGVPKAEVVTLDNALDRFVFLSDGSRVGDIYNPHFDLALSEWANTFAASKTLVRRPPDVDGVIPPAKLKPMCDVWREHPSRKTAITRTFKAGGAMTLLDPHGRLALNTWKPFDRSVSVTHPAAAGLDLFLNHIRYLFPVAADSERFLDWLAHIEQKPGELAPVAWLHITKRFGTGRNWLASVLTRVWAGNVAANVDLPGLLASGFTGQLSRKVLAFVDEIREGATDSQWAHAEKLKSLITEEQRLINPKYGRQSIEFNACRWLLFSNHLTALPLEANDRRFEVVILDAEPKSESYYIQLYGALNDTKFIAAVAGFLGRRDISRFNPGSHARQTDAKQKAARATQTPMSENCSMAVQYWQSDLITAKHLFQVLEGDRYDAGTLTPAHRRTIEQQGIEPVRRVIKLNGVTTRISILRNKDKWRDADSRALVSELMKADQFAPGFQQLMDAAANSAELVEDELIAELL